jgi:hypothetical protein
MRSDFKPVHLKEANTKLDKHVLSLPPYQEDNKVIYKNKGKTSLWKKFLRLFGA